MISLFCIAGWVRGWEHIAPPIGCQGQERSLRVRARGLGVVKELWRCVAG